MANPDELVVTVATLDDVGEIFTLQRAAFVAEAQIYGDVYLPALTQTLDELRAEIASPNMIVLSARLAHRLVASVRSERRGPSAYIGRLMVAPDLQGLGIGRRMMDEIETRAAQSGDLQGFALVTGGRSTGNIRLYERRGYKIVREDLTSPGTPLVHMEKRLDG